VSNASRPEAKKKSKKTWEETRKEKKEEDGQKGISYAATDGAA
jgi:hypothetical protein